MVCLARQVGTQGTSAGHRLNKRWASIEQAMGIDCPCGVHRVPKSQAILGHPSQICGFAFIHNASWRFCDTKMTYFMILLSDLWYFYDTSCKIIQNVSFFYPIIYQLFISTFCQKMILWYFFHKKLFTYEHILNGKSKKYLIWNLIDTSFASFAPHALNQWSPARSGIENRWPKGKAKVKGRSS